jgi:hypothetical protein
VYAREIDGRVHSFGVSGKLIMNALVMYDRETETLWSQFISQGVDGPLKDTKLEIIPATLMQWDAWLELYPDTKVLDKQGGYQGDVYTSYYLSNRAGILGEDQQDDRLSRKELVIGVDYRGTIKAYPFSALEESRLAHDTLGDTPLIVFFDPVSGAGVVHEAKVNGEHATFEFGESSGGVEVLIIDNVTGTRWNAFTGEAVEGELLGSALRRIPANYSFWFAWNDYHPDTLLFTG